MLGFSRAFSILYPRRPQHPESSSLVALGQTCAPRKNVSQKWILFPAMRSLWFLDCKDSARCLVDSTVQPYTVLISNIDNLQLCIRFHDAKMLFVHPLTGHGWCHRSFQFPCCVFANFLVFSVVWINQVNLIPLSLRALSSSGFSIAQSCFSRFWAASPFFVHASGHT